jgi:beta-glucosidase/6-phospho-beta-glucosidase/beta-galactosidase
MKEMGLKHFRMSFSWPRLLPDGTSDNVNQLGVDFYNKLFDALDAAGIEYFVTLFHWDLPAALMKNSATDAWLSRDIID